MSDHFGTLWIKGLKHSQRIHSTKPHPNFKAIISLKISFRQKGLFKKSIRLIYFFGRWIINFLSLYINILQSTKLLQRWFNGFSTWSSCNILTKRVTNSHVVLPMKLYGSKKKKNCWNPSDSFICMQSMNGSTTHGTIEDTLHISANLHLDRFHFHKLPYCEQMYLLFSEVIEIPFQYDYIWCIFVIFNVTWINVTGKKIEKANRCFTIFFNLSNQSMYM